MSGNFDPNKLPLPVPQPDLGLSEQRYGREDRVMTASAAVSAWRTILSILGALTGCASVIGMLVGAVWTISSIDAGFTDLSRRMGIAETQMTALTSQVFGLREAVIWLEDAQPSRHAGHFGPPSPAPNLWTNHAGDYHGGGLN